MFTIDSVKSFWDEVAEKYEHAHKDIEDVHFQRFEVAIKYLELNDGDKVLNIWSRTGEAIPFLRQCCNTIELYNLEVSPNFMKIAKERFGDEMFLETDLNKLDIEDDFFDSILCLETLEHTPSPETLLRELNRVLKKDGKLVMSLPPATAEFPLRIYELFFNNHGEGPHRFLSSRNVKRLLSETGFELIEHKGTLLIPIGPKMLKKAGEFIIESLQGTYISEFGIRQFYVAAKRE